MTAKARSKKRSAPLPRSGGKKPPPPPPSPWTKRKPTNEWSGGRR